MRYLFILSFLLMSCTRPALESVSWKNGDNIRDLHFLNEMQNSLPETIQVLDENLEYSKQTFAGIEIEDTFVKRINEQDGELLSVAALYKKNTKSLKKLPLDQFKITSEIKDQILHKYSFLSRKDIATLQPVIGAQSQMFWRLSYFTPQGVPHLLKLTPDLKVISDQPTGISWFDQRIFVFPSGPKFSELQEVVLQNISFSPPLSNSAYEITSLIEAPFYQNSSALKFETPDPRLDQVQAYFYVERSLQWIKNTLGIQFPLFLDIQLHVGHPEKTNAAFYYAGKIRLGEGDGSIYDKIPQDPTIVSHEVFHGLIDILARLPTQGEGGSLNEAFADFFTSQMLHKPQLGDTAYLQGPFKRTLNIKKNWSEKSGGLYGDSLIISSLLWQLSQELPSEKILKVSLKTLAHLNPASDFQKFNIELRASLKELLSAEELSKALEIMNDRGFPQ